MLEKKFCIFDGVVGVVGGNDGALWKHGVETVFCSIC